ncbi:hypothetical protein D9M72_594910 [compost metagenome]
MFGFFGLLKVRDLRGQRIETGFGGAEIAHHVAFRQLLAQVRHGLLHIGGGGLGAHPLFEQDNLGHHVIVLAGEVAEGFLVADVRVLTHGVFFAVDGQEDVAVAFYAAPACGFGQGGSRGNRSGDGNCRRGRCLRPRGERCR